MNLFEGRLEPRVPAELLGDATPPPKPPKITCDLCRRKRLDAFDMFCIGCQMRHFCSPLNPLNR